jgi:uncharacterized protein (DUF433 family)
MTAHDRIEINAKIMLGKPVIRGTRIPVELIVRKMAESADEKAVLQAYPTLTSTDVRAALRYAADSLAHKDFGQLVSAAAKENSGVILIRYPASVPVCCS